MTPGQALVLVLVALGLFATVTVALVGHVVRTERARVVSVIAHQREIAHADLARYVEDTLGEHLGDLADTVREQGAEQHRETRRDLLVPFERDTYTGSQELPVQPQWGPPVPAQGAPGPSSAPTPEQTRAAREVRSQTMSQPVPADRGRAHRYTPAPAWRGL